MSMLDAKTKTTLDTFVYKQLLHSAGLDKNMSGMAGMMFTDVLAETIAKNGPSLMPQQASPDDKLATAAANTPSQMDPLALPATPGITSNFGSRIDPLTHKPSIHPGVDVKASQGEPIVAAWDGKVISAGDRGGYGNAVELDHGNGVHTLYAHASALHVKAGDTVHAGDTIADVGSSGRSTGPHLHLELRIDGKPVDPSNALKAYRNRADDVIRGQTHEDL
jgi:murein DD-endopeptidase MepM/ murein hydrolase activator NlpD